MNSIYKTINLNEHNVIEASAGTGKTYTIEHLVLRLITTKNLNSKVDGYLALEKILLVTFTEKATGELKSRIRNIIVKKIKDLEKDSDKSLIDHLQYCLNNFDLVSIQTIHGFCNNILKQFPFECDLPFDSDLVQKNEIVSSLVPKHFNQWTEELKNLIQSQKLFPKSILLPKNFSGWQEYLIKLLTNFNPERGDEIHPYSQNGERLKLLENHIKEKVSTIDNLLESGINTSNFNGLNDSYYKLHTELKVSKSKINQRILKLLNPVLESLVLTTKKDETDSIYKFTKSLLSLKYGLFNKCESFKALVMDLEKSEDELIAQWSLYSQIDISNLIMCLDEIYTMAKEYRYIKEFLPIFSLIKNIVQDEHKVIEKVKNSLGQITYDDMISRVYRALNSKNSFLLKILRNKYSYGIIDEFQDTNPLQWNIFHKIFIESSIVSKHVLYVIGDPKQSIFSFQGGDLATYSMAKKQIMKKSQNTPELTINFRSSPNMINAYNLIFNQRDWFGSIEQMENYHKVTPDPKYDKKNVTGPVVFHDVSEVPEANAKRHKHFNWISEKIQDLVNKESINPVQDISFHYGDIAVMVQKKKEADDISSIFANKGIPFTRYKETGLFQTEESLHLKYLLEGINQPENIEKFNSALLTQFFQYSLEGFGNSGNNNRPIPDRDTFHYWNQLAQRGRWGLFFSKIFNDTGILFRIHFYPDGDRKISIYNQLKSFLIKTAIEENHNLKGLIDKLTWHYNQEITIDEDLDRINKESDRHTVQILTIHASKGLEFPVVFLAGGSGAKDKRINYWSISKNTGGKKLWVDKTNKKVTREYINLSIQEYKRLYYVALTRAKYLMYLPIFNSETDSLHKIQSVNFKSPSEYFLSQCFWNVYNKNTESGLFQLEKYSKIRESEKSISFNMDPDLQKKSMKEILDSAIQDFGVKFNPVKMDLNLKSRVLEQTSYSSIAHGQTLNYSIQGRENREDHLLPEEDEEKKIAQYLLPKGASTGTSLHEILEEISFEKVGKFDSPIKMQQDFDSVALIKQKMAAYNIDDFYLDEIIQIIWTTLHTKLIDPANPNNLFALHEVKNKSEELEFHFTFDQNGDIFPNKNVTGYVVGYIDLVFEWNDKYYIVDWKSNYLPNYSPENVRQSMIKEQYFKQSLLYGVAMDKWLSDSLPNYSMENNFGGIIYLYLRGIKINSSNGINSYRPSSEELRKEFPLEVKKLFKASNLSSILK